MLTNDYIRGLCGLSAAELPDKLLDDTKIIPKVMLSRAIYFNPIVDLDEHNPTQEAFNQLDYMGYKAISMLKNAIQYSVPQKIKDNFNEFTRFSTISELFDFADSYVAKVEATEDATAVDAELFTLVTPATDPVTEEG